MAKILSDLTSTIIAGIVLAVVLVIVLVGWHDAGLALHNQGDIDQQAIAGVTAAIASWCYLFYQGGVSAGVLTTLGRDHAFELGQKIRAKYINQHKLLGDQYNQTEIL